jgi:hypothetical protein
MRSVSLVVLAVCFAASPLRAEDQWGFSVGLTPNWQTGAPVKHLFAADDIQMHGSEVRFGVVRGDLYGGDWGFSFVDKSIDEDSTVMVNAAVCEFGPCGTFYRSLPQTRLTGVEFHQFRPFMTWRDRVQIGMVGAVGVGWLRGTADKRTTSALGSVESHVVTADELFPPSASVVPLMKLELAATGILAPGLKVRVGGGFSMPGYHTFGITASYLVPKR